MQEARLIIPLGELSNDLGPQWHALRAALGEVE